MASYAAFIGHQPHLSQAELAATVPGFTVERTIDRSVILFQSKTSLGAAFLKTLGGTIILAEKLPEEVSLNDVPAFLARRLMSVKGKATFSLRTLGLPPATVRNFYRNTKAELKKKGKPSRYVGNERTPAPSIVLHENGLLDKSGGVELCILQWQPDADLRSAGNARPADPAKPWMGFTVGAQDIEKYVQRDMKKPVRDTTTGLLPPKLAQILINFGIWLTKKNPHPHPIPIPKPRIYDPFCGTGVIPMECLVRGFPVLASDKSERAVKGCDKNLEWVRKQFEIKKSDVPSRVWRQDAVKPFLLKEGVDVIVTETSLGPALEKRPSVRDLQKMKSENEALQEGFLKSAASSLPGVPVVCTWPVWYPPGPTSGRAGAGKTPIFLERIWKTVSDLGYQAMLPPTLEIVGNRVSLLYRRPGQFVGREIMLLHPARRG